MILRDTSQWNSVVCVLIEAARCVLLVLGWVSEFMAMSVDHQAEQEPWFILVAMSVDHSAFWELYRGPKVALT